MVNFAASQTSIASAQINLKINSGEEDDNSSEVQQT